VPLPLAILTTTALYYGYRECRWVQRVDAWGNLRTFKVCDVY
jgi:hypothetical protein